MEEKVFDMLKDMNYKIGFCESCTGGLISGKFARISGVSQVFDRSIITYSNEAKIEELNINPKILEKYGAVSEEISIEMSKGLLMKSNIDIALSVTGIAGPGGGSEEKPVGLVYLCIASRKNHSAIKLMLSGNREEIQDQVVSQAFVELEKYLKTYH